MNIDKKQISIKELIEGYRDDEESGEVVAYADKGKARLNIRPKYQREFVYKDKERAAVISTVLWGFPLNTMYWSKNPKGSEYEFEVLDGQQRTISICQFCAGVFSLTEMQFRANWAGAITSFSGLPKDQKEKFLDYKLDVYICEGDDSEKLEWFKTINIAGKELKAQELRNAIYVSTWLDDAKRYFSRKNCKAKINYENYLTGEYDRQDILEKALSWMVGKNELIETYMSKQKTENASDANELWSYFQNVMSWVESKFPKYRKEMKGLEWGQYYSRYKDKKLDAKELEARIAKLMQDDEVKSKKGVYEYVLSDDERHLNLRAFSESIKRAVYEKQGGICANSKGSIKGVKCFHEDEKLDIGEMEADHIIPWSKGGKSEKENCQMLCRECNRRKSNK